MGKTKTQVNQASRAFRGQILEKINPAPEIQRQPVWRSNELSSVGRIAIMRDSLGVPGKVGQAKITTTFQRQIGNTGVIRMFRDSSPPATLSIGSQTDVYEQEADRVADNVVSGRVSKTAYPLSLRTREDKKLVTRQSRPSIQKSPGPWRYKPPVTVTRSIEEMQAVAGTTPDGIYGPRTRAAVKRYQTKLKAEGLYAKILDGKWGDFTEAGHVDFATGTESETYNCAGLAFKTFTFHGMADTNTILASMTSLSNCGEKCKPLRYKFWYWEYDVSLTNLASGVTSPVHRDFHIVGGQNNWKGEGPNVVVSKNGRRPVKGPAPPASWKPVTGPAHANNHTDTIVPGFRKNRTNHSDSCFCADTLP